MIKVRPVAAATEAVMLGGSHGGPANNFNIYKAVRSRGWLVVGSSSSKP